MQFNGIILSDKADPSYLVKFSYFPNAFTWSWPSAPTSPTSGILLSGPTSRLDPFALIETIPGSRDGLPDIPLDEYRCLQSHYYPPDLDMQCNNSFWTAVLRNRIFSFTMSLAWLPLLLHVSVAAVLLWLWACEWMIVKKKGWMRCQCPKFVQGLCPLPKGSAKDMELLGEHDWDKVRAWLYWTAVAYCFLPLLHGAIIGSLFVSALGYFDHDLPHGMSVDAKLGGGYLGLVAGSAAAAVVSALCVTVRWYLGRPVKGWMDQQEAGGLDPAGGEAYEGYRGGGRGGLAQRETGGLHAAGAEPYEGPHGGKTDRLAQRY